MTKDRSESGLSLIEVLAASAILIIVVVSLSNLLVDSLRVALVSKQNEVAAGLAGDMIENAKALGQAALVTPTGSGACVATYGTAAVPVPLPARTAACLAQPFAVFVDSSHYTVTPALSAPAAGGAEAIAITVTWTSGLNPMSYHAYSLIGP